MISERPFRVVAGTRIWTCDLWVMSCDSGVSLLSCGSCTRGFSYRRPTAFTTPVCRCSIGCRRLPLPAETVERAVGEMILRCISPGTNPARAAPLTVKTAVRHAPRMITSIIVGTEPTDLRVRWRTSPPNSGTRPVMRAVPC